MKKLITIIVLFLFGTQSSFAQKPLKIELKDKKKDVIYLSKTKNNDIDIVVSNKANELDSKKSVNAKDNSVNIFLEWINPLKYKLTWRDTTLTDERDKAISDFVSLLVGQFGKQVSDLNVPKSSFLTEPTKNDSTEIKGIDFKDKDLLLLLIHLRANQNHLNIKDKGEIYKLNNFFEILKNLDDLVFEDVSASLTKIYSALFDYKDIKDYNDKYSKQTKEFSDIEANLEKIETGRKTLAENIKSLTIEDKMLQSYTNAVLNSYLEKSLAKLNNDKKITSKLKPILEIVKASTENESEKYKGNFKIRNVEFEDGKRFETVLTITEYEFKKETAEFTKKSEILNKTFSFQKYDIFDIAVSTGLFFGNTTLKGFGVSNDANTFKVTEDDINKNSAITAVFLNFNFKTSRYFSPLLQLGIDPTKKRPFLLLGGGFSIPVARIAFSAGPIWTWNQSLDKLKVGQTINSTTDLDKDIKYKFEVEPKGWYFGIQYNF